MAEDLENDLEQSDYERICTGLNELWLPEKLQNKEYINLENLDIGKCPGIQDNVARILCQREYKKAIHLYKEYEGKTFDQFKIWINNNGTAAVGAAINDDEITKCFNFFEMCDLQYKCKKVKYENMKVEECPGIGESYSKELKENSGCENLYDLYKLYKGKTLSGFQDKLAGIPIRIAPDKAGICYNYFKICDLRYDFYKLQYKELDIRLCPGIKKIYVKKLNENNCYNGKDLYKIYEDKTLVEFQTWMKDKVEMDRDDAKHCFDYFKGRDLENLYQ